MPSIVLKMNFFIYCRIIKTVKNTCEEAKFLIYLMVYSLKYTIKQWTPSVFVKLSNPLKILLSPKK